MNLRFARLGRPRPAVAAIALAATGALVAAGCGSSTVASVVRVNAITVNGTSVSRDSFERDISALSSNAKLKALDKTVAAQGTTSDRLFDSSGHATRTLTTSWMNRIVNQLVVDQEFTGLKLTVSATDKTEGASQFAQLFATSTDDGTAVVKGFPSWFQKAQNADEARLVAVTTVLDSTHQVTTAQMKAFYKENVGTLCASGINVAHILLKTLPEAQSIEAQLHAGASFAALAKAKSIDTGSAAKGGSLGCFATGQFVAPFEAATEKAKVGVPTAPVHSQYGYHVILVTKFVPPPFASVETQIRQEILQQLNLLQTFVTAGLKKATVHVDPTYGTWNTKTFRVDAPKVPAVRNSRNAPPTTVAVAPPVTPTT
jgi:parvulin-like peptidyl-prolyl isomerase